MRNRWSLVYPRVRDWVGSKIQDPKIGVPAAEARGYGLSASIALSASICLA